MGNAVFLTGSAAGFFLVMNWLNIETRTLHDPAYIGSEPKARATWLNVILWCASQENGGIIDGAANWKCRQWQQTCGVTKREVEQAKNLLSIEGESVVVWNYPLSKQAEVQAKRQAGRQGGLLSGASRASSKSEAELQAKGQAVLERKGKEGKGKEENPLTPLQGELVRQDALFPKILQTPEFSAAWQDWLAYRRERRLPACKPKSIETQLRTLSEWGHDVAIVAIRESIRQNWQGLFLPKTANSAPKSVLEERFAKAW